MSVKGIALEKFNSLPTTYINSTKPSRKCHAVFHSFLYDDIKQDAATTTAHREILILLLKEKNY